MSDIVGGRQTSPRRREKPQFANGKRSLTASLYSKKSFAYRYRGGGRETVRAGWGELPLITLAEADDLNFVTAKHYRVLMRISYPTWRKLPMKPCAAVRDGPGESHAYPLYPTHLPIPAEIY